MSDKVDKYWCTYNFESNPAGNSIRLVSIAGHGPSEIGHDQFKSNYLYVVGGPRAENALTVCESDQQETYRADQTISLRQFISLQKRIRRILKYMNTSIFYDIDVTCSRIVIDQLLPCRIYYTKLHAHRQYMIIRTETWAFRTVDDPAGVKRYVYVHYGRPRIMCHRMDIERNTQDRSVINDGHARVFNIHAGATYSYEEFDIMHEFLNDCLFRMGASEYYARSPQAFVFVTDSIGSLRVGE